MRAPMVGGLLLIAAASRGCRARRRLDVLDPARRARPDRDGRGLSTAPATAAIVTSLPPAKQGVASAVNDTAREVGGALGIAVLGSVLADRYTAGVGSAAKALPGAAGEQASSSLAGALAVAQDLGRPELAQAAQAAFIDGLSTAVLTAAAAIVLAALWVAVRAPHGVDGDVPAATALQGGAAPPERVAAG
jgi:hypothetical protein